MSYNKMLYPEGLPDLSLAFFFEKMLYNGQMTDWS